MSNISTKMMQAAASAGGLSDPLYTISSSGLTVLDASNPSALSIVNRISVSNSPLSLDLNRSVLFAGGNSVDVTDPANPVLISSGTNDRPTALDTTTNTLYALNTSSGTLTSYNVTNPSSILLLDTLSASGLTAVQDMALDVTNKYLYIAQAGTSTSSNYITVINVNNPSSLSVANQFRIYYPGSRYSVGWRSICLDVPNSVAYLVAQDTADLVGLDISNPTGISALATALFRYQNTTFISSPRALAFDATNSILYLAQASPSYKFVSIDVSNTSSISILDTLGNSGLINDPASFSQFPLDLNNGVAYVTSAANDAINTINISNPSNLSYNSNGFVVSSTDLNDVAGAVLASTDPANTKSYT